MSGDMGDGMGDRNNASEASAAGHPLKVMVLAGGPDREREVSLKSGSAIKAALERSGHEVRLRDPKPDDLSCLDEFAAWGGDVIFPALHGPWGEGGPLQAVLESRGVRYVGCGPEAAGLCMDKYRTKQKLAEANLPTAPYELVGPDDAGTIAPPLVIKPLTEGSSIDLVICPDSAAVDRHRADLHTRHDQLMLEQFIDGMELTVGVIVDGQGGVGEAAASSGASSVGASGYVALPPIHIVPATAFYDYQAKYERDDTQYRFEIDLPPERISTLQQMALSAFFTLGCRHLSRIDFIVDRDQQPWILEVNTLPGFTSHSLLPMAAARAGVGMENLVDRLTVAAL